MEKEPTTWLWHIERVTDPGYDEYDSAVVAAHTMNQARHIFPGGGSCEWLGSGWSDSLGAYSDAASATWVTPSDVRVTRIGRADRHIKPGAVVCASFNAG